MFRKIVRNILKRLRNKIDIISDDYLEQITKVIIKAIKEYPKNWDKHFKEIEELFYEFLVQVYNLVNIYLKKIYKDNLPDLDVEDIYELTYDIDGKLLIERLEEYWNEAEKRLKKNINDKTNILNYLVNMYNRILFTESRVVESKLKKLKKPKNAAMLIIESGCDNCEGGEYPADEDVTLPPYHPYCNCQWYWDYTDSEDDINDLDLEIEE